MTQLLIPASQAPLQSDGIHRDGRFDHALLRNAYSPAG
ncbi:hypothetical protein WQQ_03670 [Hydrocarboniphaga effusa AP103]|uniref:Uncharacterized protein n=1 Tax=Hydrocarboniphaga effusa AP103 TaxID=1172194 RepID=I8T8I6_9GAMM|nr:hypothetical protein WQQ_01800 [Hydrocarboniphaga effusa AP103]EIT70230.1 hypothetical protein WQQ_03670 [Hydrocarboniphaga effusa AP103]